MSSTKRVSIVAEPAPMSPSEGIDARLGRLSVDHSPTSSATRSESLPPSILRNPSSHTSSSSSDFPRTLTSTSTHSTSSSSSHSHSHPSRSFIRSILPHTHDKDHHSHQHHRRSSSHIPAAHVTVPGTPVALCELFLQVLFTHPGGMELDEIKRDLGPRIVHKGYMHRVNCREYDVEGMWEMAEFFRTRFDSSRVRVRSILMDQDGTATMEQAAVAITYELIGVIHRGKHAEPEEIRVNAVGVYKVFEGLLAQGDVVIDTMPFHLANRNHQKEVGCVVM